ncbi:MAG TPA: trypsin-like peptidase domain-containing protein, partial [Chitinophagaceae bacterium]|nr:trypsin-like peptidase domain-containing protein [Chitinophagaceae bacterium]
MIDDIKILEAVEQYINGQMSPDERVYFEQLRKSNPEIDQLVVEHTFFLHQINRFDEKRKLKHIMNDVHIELAEKGLIKSPRLQGKAKIVYLYNRYKRVTAIAASIAGITALAISGLFIYLSPAKQKGDIEFLSGQIKEIKNQNRQQSNEIKNIKENIKTPIAPAITYKTGGTGFLIDQKGYIVTNAHVVADATNIAVQNVSGKEFTVTVVFK